MGGGPAAGYDRLARWYPSLERLAFGDRLDRVRRAHLDRLANCRRVLLVGDGVGRSLEAVLQSQPQCHVHSVDISAAMLRAAGKRREIGGFDRSRVAFEQADVERWSPQGQFDAVVTPFFLDLFEGERLERVVERLAGAVRTQGFWLMADFTLPERGWRRQRARVWLWTLYRFFRAVSSTPARRLHDPGDLIVRQGFCLVDEQTSNQGLLVARLYARQECLQAAESSLADAGSPELLFSEASSSSPSKPA